MKTCLINGTMRKGSTYQITRKMLSKMDADLNNEVTEFFLPRDMGNFCVGCYQCIFRESSYVRMRLVSARFIKP